MSLNDLLQEPEQQLAKLKQQCEEHTSLADKVHHLYMDNAMAGSYRPPFDNTLESYAMKDDESFEGYCDRLLTQAERLREQAVVEETEAKNLEANEIPSIVCDYQCGARRRTASMKRPNPFGKLSPFTEPVELHWRNPV